MISPKQSQYHPQAVEQVEMTGTEITSFFLEPHPDNCRCNVCRLLRKPVNVYLSHVRAEAHQVAYKAGLSSGIRRGENLVVRDLENWLADAHDNDCDCWVCDYLKDALQALLAR